MNDILKFKPILKAAIWGGQRIASFKGIAAEAERIGESWELSPMPGSESIVASGPLAGRTLTQLIQECGNDIMGRRLMEKYGAFPLLIKFIDSTDDLSIQVHPDDELAKKRHDSLGKTEMWYSVRPEPGAYLYSGFARPIKPEEFRRQVADNTIVESLARHEAKPGDVFFLPAGRVHSIGKGNLILEIQEASDITYRIHDYDRRDKDGKPRQLHVEEAECAIRFDDTGGAASANVLPKAGQAGRLCGCQYFEAEAVGVDGAWDFDFSSRDSFTVLVAIDGGVELEAPGKKASLRQGETALIPKSLPRLRAKGKGSLVSIWIP